MKNDNIKPVTSEITINIESNTDVAKKIIEEISKPKPVFVGFATYDGPTLTKTMYR